MAIEIIPKPKKRFSWATILFAICIVLLLGLAGTYYYFYQSSDKISQNIRDRENALIKTSSEKALEKKIILYEAKINTFAKLLSAHKKPLNIFNFLEEVCHPDVWLSDFELSSTKGMVIVSGKAKSFIALGQQLLIFKEVEYLKNVNLSEISIGEEGGVDFTLQLTFEPQVFK
jgi:hypothetical protein